MIDYYLFICFLQKQIQSYRIFGNYNLHPNIIKLLNAKNITSVISPDLILFYKEDYIVVDYYCKNYMKEQTNYLVFVANNTEELMRYYREFNKIGECYLLEKFLTLFIKNIKPNFQEKIRENILIVNNSTTSFNEFLKPEIEECKYNYIYLNENEENNIIKSLNEKYQYIAIGNIEENIDLCRMISKYNFDFIEVKTENNINKGFFYKQNLSQIFWIWKYTQYTSLEKIMKFNQTKITIIV